MNLQRYTLPATVAAAFHAVLLWAMPSGNPTITAPQKKPPVEIRKELPAELMEIPLTNETRSEEREVTPLAAGAARPSLEEVVTQKVDSPFVVTPIENSRKTLVTMETLGPIGVPEGILGVEPGGRGAKKCSPEALDKTPRAKVQIPPDYPPSLRNEKIEGVVMVEFDVDASGKVVSARVKESSYYAFEEPTIRAVLKWRFEPGLKDGRPVPFRMVIPVNFKLSES